MPDNKTTNTKSTLEFPRAPLNNPKITISQNVPQNNVVSKITSPMSAGREGSRAM